MLKRRKADCVLTFVVALVLLSSISPLALALELRHDLNGDAARDQVVFKLHGRQPRACFNAEPLSISPCFESDQALELSLAPRQDRDGRDVLGLRLH
eukprot:3258058-Pleurochrysis_carterae.AAC.2